eukprot:gene19041-23325_t
MLSVINEKRLELGMSTLGWINPALYAQATHYVRDITSGHNRCTALYNAQGSSTCCAQGYYAATGWDPVTGLGSLDFERFYSVFALNDTTSLVYDDDEILTNSNDDAETTDLTPTQQIIGDILPSKFGSICPD